jgi:hypothetical protein
MMNLSRNLSFEINRECNLGKAHAGFCPNVHSDRYRWSKSPKPITDDLIFEFWKWCREKHYFRGLVNWNGMNEPTLVLDRIYKLMERMRAVDPGQPIQIVTNNERIELPGFDVVKRSRYRKQTRLCDDGKQEFDNRLAALEGEGLAYDQVIPFGRCLRGMGWEIIIDFYGNWLLCCNDWRNEESFGSICEEDWETIYQRWEAKARTMHWTSEEEYNALPRMCRACLFVNPSMHFREDIDILRRLPEGRR